MALKIGGFDVRGCYTTRNEVPPKNVCHIRPQFVMFLGTWKGEEVLLLSVTKDDILQDLE